MDENRPFRVLSVDPGTRIVGYAVLDWHGGRGEVVTASAIRLKESESLTFRLLQLHQELTRLFQQYEPVAVAVEDVFFAKNARSALKLGEARGVVLLSAAKMNIPIAEYSPAEVKQAIVGHGGASKQQMQRMVAALLGLPAMPQPFDVADALAIALCHCHRQASAYALAKDQS